MGLLRSVLTIILGVIHLLPFGIKAQTTNSCFEIEQILVDACAPVTPNREGVNEMVRFIVGPNSLNTNDLVINWPNTSNPWQGVCRNSTTAAVVAQLNASIGSCATGRILEPTGGILPPNSKVIIVTSANMDVSFNSFEGLQETIYMIFQCGAETAGHFANYNLSPGLRTLTMRFQTGCTDQVTYDRSKLVDQAGNIGEGPPVGPKIGDGASVIFTPGGVPSYTNQGCIAPITPLSANWDVPPPVCSGSGAFDLNNFITGTTGGTWSGQGVSGSTFNPAGLSGAISITYKVGPLNCTVEKTQNINVQASGNASWTNPGVLCSDVPPLNLNNYVTGTAGGTWSGTGVSGSMFNPAGLNGSISVTYTAGAGACSASQTLQILITPSLSAAWTQPGPLCENAPAIDLNIFVTGNSGGAWSGQGVSGNTFKPTGLNGSIPVTYTIGSGACQTVSTQSIIVNQVPAPPGPINGRTIYCNEPPEPLQVTALSGAVVEWYRDQGLTDLAGTGKSFTPVAQSATYYVVQILAGCRSNATAVNVQFQPAPAIPVVQDTVRYCEGTEIPAITAAGTGVIWFGDATLQNELFRGNTFTPPSNSPPALYLIAVSGNCRSSSVKVNLKKELQVSVQIDPEGPLTLCRNASITLRSNRTAGNIWSNGSTGSSIEVAQSGLYRVRVEGFCNVASDSVQVIDRSVTASFTLSAPGGSAPIDIVVTETSINATSRSWYLNGVPVSLQDIDNTLSFEEEGEYKLTLIVSNTTGCSDSISRIIRIFSDFVSLYIPNTFSPNGDNTNDVFRIYSTGLKEINVLIYNRWGDEVAQFDGLKSGWDGMFQNAEIEEGIYVYRLQARDFLDRGIKRLGRLLLIK